MHKRREIKTFVKNLIETIPDFSGKVFINEKAKIQDSQLPYVNINTNSESADVRNSSPRSYTKRFTYSVEIFVKGENEDVLDDYSGQVENLILGNDRFDELVEETLIQDIEYGEDFQGAYPIMACRITFESMYEQQAPLSSDVVDFERNDFDLSVSDESENMKGQILHEV